MTSNGRIPAPAIGHVSDEISEYLSTFTAMERKPEQVLKGNRKPPYFDITAPAYARSNRQAAIEAGKAARAHNLQSSRFEAVRGKWSDKHHAMLLMPEETYNQEDPELYKVTWSPDGKEMRIDLAEGLVPRQWATPTGYIRRVDVTRIENLPTLGTVLSLDLGHSSLREDPAMEKERQKRKAAKEAAAGPKEVAATGEGKSGAKPAGTAPKN